MKIGDANFRQIHRNFVVIKGDKIKNQFNDIETPIESDSVLTWCYCDTQCGITFEFICHFDSKEKKLFEIANKDFSAKWRRNAVNDCEMEVILQNEIKISDETLKYIIFILANYESDDELNNTRKVICIDHLREKDYPDDITVLLYKKDLKPEVIWVHLEKLKDGILLGRMLNEPNSDFGIHYGDVIEIDFYKDNNDLRAVYLCK